MANHPQSASPLSIPGQTLDPLESALDGRAMELEPCGQIGEGRLRRLASGGGHDPDDRRLLGEPSVGLEPVDRPELARRCDHSTLEIGRLGVDDPVDIAPHGSCDLPTVEFEDGRTGADATQERADRLGALPGHHTAAATRSPRCRQVQRGESPGEDGRLIRGHDELEVGATRGQAERATRKEPAAQPGQPAVVRDTVPVERLCGGIALLHPHVPGPASRREQAPCLGRFAPESDGQAGDRRLARGKGGPEAREFGVPIACPLRHDRGQFGPDRGDQVALAPAHARSVMPCPAADRSCRSSDVPAATPSGAVPFGDPDDRGGQADRVVLARIVRVDQIVEDEPGRYQHVWRPAQPDRVAIGVGVRGAARRRPVVGEDDVDDPARDVPLERLDVVGQIEVARLAGLGGDIADVDPGSRGRQQGVPDLGRRGPAGRS